MTIDFIGRKKDLEAIRRVVLSEKTRILCIFGDGGIGKTRLLNQVIVDCENIAHLRICEIIDFDEPRYHVPDYIGQKIAHEIGKAHFPRYFQELQHRLFLENHKASPEYISHQNRKINAAFLDEYSSVAETQRILLLFDSTDNIRGSLAPLEYIGWLVKNLPNTCILVAGRNSPLLLDVLGVDSNLRDEMILNLLPITNEECVGYLDLKLAQKKMILEQKLREKLISLANGKIILLDAAVDWLWNQNIPPGWLREFNVENKDLQKNHVEFERGLFDHILKGEEWIDSLILLLSKIYPLDKTGVQYLLELQEKEAEDLFNKAINLAFVKMIPGGVIKLHDEAERIINEYLWPIVAPRRLRHIREKAISYLESRSHSILEGLAQDDVDKSYNLYAYLAQQLRHLLNLDLDRGYELFLENYEIADQSRNFIFQKMILDEVLPYKDQLIDRGKEEFILFQAERLIRDEKYQEAIVEYYDRLINEISPRNNLLYLRAIKGKGIASYSDGHTEDAIQNLELACRIAKETNNDDMLFLSTLALAQVQHSIGDVQASLKAFLYNLRQSIKKEDREKQAIILSDLAYLKSLQGQSKQAIILIEQSIYLWRQLQDEKPIYQEGLGKAFYNAGRIYLELGIPNKALDYFSLSWDTMMALNLEEWRSIIKVERAIAYWLGGQKDDAINDIEWVLEHGTKLTLYKAYFASGQIEWKNGNNKRASDHLILSLFAAREVRDIRIILKSLCLLTSIAFDYEWGELNSLEDFEEYLQQINQDVFEQYPWLNGVLYTHLGHIAAKSGYFNKAVKYYKQGLSNQNNHQSENAPYENFSLNRQLSFINDKIIRLLSPEMIPILGQELNKFWSEKGLDIDHPEVLLFFSQWENYRL